LTEAGKQGFEALATSCPQPGDNGSWDNLLKESPDRIKTEVVEDYPTLRFAQPLFIGAGLADTVVLPEHQYDRRHSVSRRSNCRDTLL
jgi:hypothetical protein